MPRRRTYSVLLHASNSASAAPQNQLHLANCTCRKSCMVDCDVPRGVLHAFQLRYFSTATPTPQLRSHRKINCILQIAVAEKGAWWGAGCYASKEIASALIAGVVVVVVDTAGGHQWSEKKLGWGLDSTEIDLLNRIAIPDKAPLCFS